MGAYLDPMEADYLRDAIAYLESSNPSAAQRLSAGLSRLGDLWKVSLAFPSLLDSATLSPIHHRGNSVAEALSTSSEDMGALSVPVRAIMGEVFLIAKIQLLRDFRCTLKACIPLPPETLLAAAAREVSQSIYTRILDEILTSLCQDQEVPSDLRQKAAQEVVRLWESPSELEIDDFYPILEEVWRSRERVDVIYGALTGMTELHQLFTSACPEFFLRHFLREEATPQENAAFREFLFGLPWEDLNRVEALRDEEGVGVVDRAFVESALGRPLPKSGAGTEPEEIYGSFRRRKKAAQIRRSSGQDGPYRTAEAYLTLYLLQHPEAELPRPPDTPQV